MSIFSRFLFWPALAVPLILSPAMAQDFKTALSSAYRNNPTLKAAQSQLEAVDTTVAVAQSGWRPTADLRLDGGVGRTTSDGIVNNDIPRSVTLSVVQPIWRGGRTVAATESARSDVMAARARLRDSEQSVLLDAATTYLDILQNRQIVELNRDNVSALEKQLDDVEHRYRGGELTMTDVQQAETRLAAARAEETTAEATLESTGASFVRATGLEPGEMAAPDLQLDLPATKDETISRALAQNPQIQAASFDHKSSVNNIDVARGALWPEISLRLDLSDSWNEDASNPGTSKVEEARLLGSVVVPLYHSGIDYARLAGARATATARAQQVSVAQQRIEAQAVAAWASYRSASSSLSARSQQVRTAGSALEGVEMENKAGTRSIIDVLDAQQELRNGRVSQVIAARNMILARLQLAAVTGQMTPEALSLPVTRYDPKPHYDDVDGNWFAGQ